MGVLRVGVTLEQCWHRVPGGVGRATVATTAALAAQPGLELIGVAARHRGEAPPAVDPPIPVAHHRLPRAALYRSWHRFGRPRCSAVTGPLDVIWAGAMAVPPAEVPLVATVHDLAFLDHPEWSTRRGLSFFKRSWEVTKRRATVVVAPSATTAHDCVRHGLDTDRVVVVPWGVAGTTADRDEADRLRRTLGLPEEFVLWVGTAEPRKNLPALVAAMRRLDVPLVVVGPTGWLVEPAEVLAPLGPRVRVLGPVSDAHLRSLLRAATVFAFPSLAEGFGLPVLEAMVQGTPVVTSAGTATADVAGEAAVLVDPADPDALAVALERVVGDGALRDRLAEAGRVRAAAFPWSATAAGYRQAFQRAASAGVPRP